MHRTGLRAKIDNVFKLIVGTCILTFIVIIIRGLAMGR